MNPTPAVPAPLATPADPSPTCGAPATDPTVSIHAQLHPAITQGPPHAFVQIWAGPDPEHRAHCGTLTMRRQDAAELIARITAGESALEQITPEIARHVLSHYGAPGGYQPGSFTCALMLAVACADPVNRALLRGAFPGYVSAAELAEERGGIAQLQAIAKSGAADV